MGGYQLLFGFYVLCRQLRGRRIGWVERSLPSVIITGLTLAWISTGDLASPVWVILPIYAIGHAARVPPVVDRYFIPNSASIVVASTVLIWGTNADTSSWWTAAVIWAVSAGATMAATTTANRLILADRKARAAAETNSLTGVTNRRRFFAKLEALEAGQGADTEARSSRRCSPGSNLRCRPRGRRTGVRPGFGGDADKHIRRRSNKRQRGEADCNPALGGPAATAGKADR